MFMIRSFLPVGQGAFYCEQFKCGDEKINIIYDCGSTTDVKIVEKQIKNTFEKDEVIHAVFISHLDEDHVNGIPYLVRHCHVRNIFFPLMTQAGSTFLKLEHLIKGYRDDSFVVSFIENPHHALEVFPFERRPSLHRIKVYEPENNNVRSDDNDFRSGENVAPYIFSNANTNNIIYKNWIYIPYNFMQTDRIVELQNYLDKSFERKIDSVELQRLWTKGTKADKEKIKDAYKSVKGSFNTNSMTLYSGINAEEVRQSLVNRCFCGYCFKHKFCAKWCNTKPVGCLYTGDYDASGKYKWRDLFNAYSSYWETIGCVQVPHHGSKHNYNTELANLDAYFVMSAGAHNRYHHPHTIVIKDLLFHGHYPYVVTEQKSSELQIVIFRI